MRPLAFAAIAALAGCSSKQEPALRPAAADTTAATASRHPLAKYIELAGFRLRESSPGKLTVRFAAINHSDADLGTLTVKVRIRTSVSAPEEPPVTEFEAEIPNLRPQETKDVSARAETKLRIYELPDWQFLRAEFDITSPQL